MGSTGSLRSVCAALAALAAVFLAPTALAREAGDDEASYNAMMAELSPEEQDQFVDFIAAQPQPARDAIFDVSDALGDYEHGLFAMLLVEDAGRIGGPSLVEFIEALDGSERARLASILSERKAETWPLLPDFLHARSVEEAHFAVLLLPGLMADDQFDPARQIEHFCEGPDQAATGQCTQAWTGFMADWSPPRRVRVFNASKAMRDSARWQVQLHQKGRPQDWAKSHICGAVYIGEVWALTAAHCVRNFWDSDFGRVNIRYGMLDLAAAGSEVEIEAVVRHAGYKKAPDSGDIALLRLAHAPRSPVLVGAKVPGREAARSGYPERAQFSVSGWGATETMAKVGTSRFAIPHGTSRDLRVGIVNYVPPGDCGDKLEAGPVKPGQVCAYSPGQTDACRGDSGGPLVRKRGSQDATLVGLVSFGDGCGLVGKPGVYTDVGYYKGNGWLSRAMALARATDRKVVDLADP